jgi:hypothetical protein
MPIRLMRGADFWLQTICCRLQAAGSFSKAKQSAAARARNSDAQEGKRLIPW